MKRCHKYSVGKSLDWGLGTLNLAIMTCRLTRTYGFRNFNRLRCDTLFRSLSSLPISVNISPEELAAKRLTWQNLERATRALHRDGLVVLENAVEHALLRKLNQKMVKDARTLQSAGDNSPFNYNKGLVDIRTRFVRAKCIQETFSKIPH